MGIEKGLFARIEDRFASFLWVEINEALGKIFEEKGQLLMTE